MNHTTRFQLGRAVLTAKGGAWHASGHPWVFRDDICELDCGKGFVVAVSDDRGKSLGLASWSPASKIALRFLIKGPDSAINDREAFFQERLVAAVKRREPLRRETDAMRLVHSEGDALPGLIVDAYGDVLVLQALTQFIDAHLDHIVPVLVELLKPSMVLGRNDVRVRKLEGLPLCKDLLYGKNKSKKEVLIHEHGLRLMVDPYGGQKTGYFLDQRPARAHVRKLCSEQRAGDVLDLFSYTGGIGLHALLGGAASVLCVDSSPAALLEAQAAATRNRLSGMETLKGKAMKVLENLFDEGRRFDAIICDPPAFAKSKRDVEQAYRGYLNLNTRAMRLLKKSGWLLSCSCSYNMSPELFTKMLQQAAGRAGQSYRDHGRLPHALDHPVLLNLPESDYLKVRWLERLD